MEAKISFCVILPFFICAPLCGILGFRGAAAADESTTSASRTEIVQSTLNALAKSLSFMRTYMKELNLDGLIGTRIAADQLEVFLSEMRNPIELDTPDRIFWKTIVGLKEEADAVTRIASLFVMLQDPPYFKKIGPLIEQSRWKLSYPPRMADSRLCVPKSSRRSDATEMDEDKSDDCLAELIGTSGNSSSYPCSISSSCWKVMTRGLYSGYPLTHQVFYLEVGQQAGCIQEMVKHASTHGQMSVPALQHLFCSNIWCEARSISKRRFPEFHRDLFMEQVAICGMLGYREFCEQEWVRQILQWQLPNGCYARQTFFYEHRPNLFRKPGSRFGKRREQRMTDDCLVHRTTVAIGAMTVCLRFLTEDWVS